jgi:hypothetical protein
MLDEKSSLFKTIEGVEAPPTGTAHTSHFTVFEYNILHFVNFTKVHVIIF